ncbi:MAG: prolyl aminopeptidase [Sphingobacteriia bacterium]|nr:prolyl aminopeptidase [Sphingobacteriia bacterium]
MKISYCALNYILLIIIIGLIAFIFFYNSKQTLDKVLFPKIKANYEDYLKVSDLHNLWYAEYGNPKGTPVVFLHGGPGSQCTEYAMRYFDPKFYRIVLFDQRGSGKSKPHADMTDNNSQNLISDIESLRQHLKIDKWVVFGGSWGSALAIAYGETHPDKVLGFILRGIFLGRKKEGDQLWYGMKDIFPEVWEELETFIPENERNDLAAAYYKRLVDSNPEIHLPAARKFVKYDSIAAVLVSDHKKIEKETNKHDKETLSLARTFTHYYMNNFFFRHNQLIDDLPKITHLPAIIVHGRYDIICRPQVAYELHKMWPDSEIHFADASGHSASEIGVAKELVKATEKMKKLIKH